MEYWQLALIAFVGLLTGFLNTLAGGGSLITLPLLIFLGLPPAMANGTNRIGILFQMGNAVVAFKKRGALDFKTSLMLAFPALIGAIMGSLVAVNIDDHLFKKTLAIMMILLVPTLFRGRQKMQSLKASLTTTLTRKDSIFLILIFFVLGLFGGFIQAGIGFFMIFALSWFSQYNLVHINAIKAFVILFYTIFVIGIFAASDNINWPAGLSLAAGSSVGAWVAAHFGIKKGDRLIRIMLVVTILVFSIKLLLF